MIKTGDDLLSALWADKHTTNPKIVAAAAESEEIIESLVLAFQKKIADVVLVGAQEKIKKIASDSNLDISPLQIINTKSVSESLDTSLNLLKENKADILMKGNTTTGELLKNALQKKYGLSGSRTPSYLGVGFIPNTEKWLILTDPGVNISPNFKRKKDIILNARDVARKLGCECPKIALLSFIEKIDNSNKKFMGDIQKLVSLNQQGEIDNCLVEGPYALDNAISSESVAKKKIKGKVAGAADILVAHDIYMANAIYKSMQVWAKATIGSVIFGCKKLIISSSRADSLDSKFYSIALAAYLYNR